ncbi:MAG: PEP-CTERM sorting domain-containing protein, partial [Rhodospirillales bacterium]|nr:PEP-CTERM sorting domain-containing protein [Rhodospirillales bacterium]
GGGETANTGGGSENDGSTGGGEAANTGGGSENDGSTGGGEAPSGPTVINNDPEEVIIAGLFKPGHSPGIENFNNLTLLSTATTEIEIGGLAAGLNPDGFDQVNVAGLLTLGGVLDILLYNGFFPTAGNEFQIFTFGSLAGGFSKINGRDIGGGCSFEYILNTNDITLRTIGACAGHPGNGNVNSSITSNSYEDITIQSAFLPGLNPAFEQVPEPGMLVIFGLGLVGMGVIRRRRRA